MNTEERRLSEWLHEATPAPPHPISVDDLVRAGGEKAPPAPEAPMRRRRARISAVAAACVVLAVTAILVSIHPSRRSGSPATVPDRQRTNSRPSPVEPGRTVGPWDARAITGPAAHAMPVAGTTSSLYAADGRRMLRVDPATGRVLAVGHRSSDAGPALLAGGRLWPVPSRTPGGTLRLEGLDPATLAPAATLRLSTSGGAVSAAASGHRLVVAVGDTITVLNASTTRIVATYPVPERTATSVAVSPDGARIYVTWRTGGGTDLAALDAVTGRTLGGPVHLPDPTGAVTASKGGVWLRSGEGMGLWLAFHPWTNLGAAPGGRITAAGGGFPVTGSLSDHAVWLGGTTDIACADPVTGKVRAQARVPVHHGDGQNLSSLQVAGHALFGYYRAASPPVPMLVRLTPPAACGM